MPGDQLRVLIAKPLADPKVLTTLFKKTVVVVIDALDECPDYAGYNGLLELLERLCALEGDTFRLLVTSRREADIERVMSRLATHSLSFHNHDQHKADLDQYIHAQLTGRQYSRWPNGIKRQAQQALLEKANGT